VKKGNVEAVHTLSKFLGTDLAFIDSQPRFTNTGIKFTLEQAMKAQRESRGVALLFL
jgi:hypothetical protein